MSQAALVQRVLERRRNPSPQPRRFLSLSDTHEIVEATIDYVGRHGDAVTYKYLLGHRRRLAETLARIPCANTADASCLDVGCFGYMAFWAWRHLGYARVEGVELRSEQNQSSAVRPVRVWDDELELEIHNFDLASANWPDLSGFDTVLFLETLEHINTDPSAVMLGIRDLMKDGGCLVMSAPNSVSYKTLQEFVAGMPPWTYWFFNPDLAHEPRHCFEYTPFVMEAVLVAADFEIEDLNSLISFQELENLDDVFALGRAMSIDPDMFGDTLIARAYKACDGEIVRYPDCIYDSDGYYKSTFPSILPRRESALRRFATDYANRPAVEELARANAEISLLRERADFLEMRMAEACNQHEREVGALAVAEATMANLREDLDAALEICERYFVELNEAPQGEAMLASSMRNPRLPFYYFLVRELAKLMCTLGLRQKGTSLWNYANRHLARGSGRR